MHKLSLITAALICSATVIADEGQWQPYQLPQLQQQLTARGITVAAADLADLSKYPMNAIVSLGYCSASFVSSQGLVVTNHHCAYGAIQQNSTASNNLIENGFLAKTKAEELPAGPSERLYVTELVEDVTAKVRGVLPAKLTDLARFAAIENNRKQLIQACESDANYRCSVVSFHHGLQFFLIKQLMIQDVRLVYAPTESVGNFGGDIDNYEYPRHTGDYAFLRGYVGKDGKPAAYSVDNVPYQPKFHLKINASGVKAGDGILLAGYPGQTSRYRLAEEIAFARDWQYPASVATFDQMINTIDAFGRKDAALQVRYASVVKGYNNRMKKMQGLLDGFKVTDIHAIKQQQQQELAAWIAADPARKMHEKALSALKDVVKTEQQYQQQTWYFDNAKRSDLFKAAQDLYRLAEERQKPDSARELGYQQRDFKMWQGRLKRLDTSFAAEVDLALWSQQLAVYLQQPPALRVKALDDALGILPGMTAAQIGAALKPWYDRTTLNTSAGRLAWLDKTPTEFANSDDPFIKAAVAVHQHQIALEQQQKAIQGALLNTRPAYMQAVIAFNQSKGKPVYPDANSTLRITYGHVDGYPAVDGVYKTPFTSVRGMIAKQQPTGVFQLPEKLVQAYQAKQYDGYFHADLAAAPALPFNSVPLNFLSSADTTGGNSGSAVMNGKGELIGLNFDSTYESISKDWYFNPAITRAIHVDIRFVLWMMQYVDGAENLLDEMTIVRD
jgi:hypothetical protein